jgi:signal transduction histidine kinase
VQVTTGCRAGRPFLAVTNSGPVIPPDQLGRLFRPFQRMDPARRAPGGLGLGLAIVQAIAAAHGADLNAVTRAAGGLAIEIRFPPGPPPAGQDHETPASAPREAVQPGIHVMVG